MTLKNQNVGKSGDTYVEGDSLELVFTITEDGSVKDLGGSTTEWALIPGVGGSEVLDESDSGVSSLITDADSGEVTVTIEADVTDGLAASYKHELRLTDGSGKKSVVAQGDFIISTRYNA